METCILVWWSKKISSSLLPEATWQLWRQCGWSQSPCIKYDKREPQVLSSNGRCISLPFAVCTLTNSHLQSCSAESPQHTRSYIIWEINLLWKPGTNHDGQAIQTSSSDWEAILYMSQEQPHKEMLLAWTVWLPASVQLNQTNVLVSMILKVTMMSRVV